MVKIHAYFKHYKKQTVLIVVAAQVAAVILTLLFANVFPYLTLPLLIGFMLVANLLVTPLIVYRATRPFGVLAQAVAHVSKDPVITEPPKLIPADEPNGLKALVQTVYELAVVSPQKSEKSSTQHQTFFEQIATNMPCGIIVLGGDNQVIYANKIAPVAVQPDGSQKITLNFEQNDTLAKWLADCQANKVRDNHMWVRVADKLPGEPNQRIFDIAGYYQRATGGNIEAVLVTFDRTSLYQVDQEDMDFIALAAHELRGPITVIRGYLDVFKDELATKLDDEQKQLLERLEVAAERLAGYVNNILNVSRYDRHQFKLHLHEEKLPEIMLALAPDLKLRAKTQNRALVFEIPSTLPTVAADRSSIGEVISNLVDNAIKYSNQGGTVVIAATPKEGQVEITVTDSGIGISASVIGNLFNRFYRSHHSSQTVGGTGLGLYICKAIVEMHGGSIWVRSVEGQGSTFGFTLAAYAQVADKLKNGDNNSDIVQRPEGWIKNHAMIRR